MSCIEIDACGTTGADLTIGLAWLTADGLPVFESGDVAKIAIRQKGAVANDLEVTSAAPSVNGSTIEFDIVTGSITAYITAADMDAIGSGICQYEMHKNDTRFAGGKLAITQGLF